MALKSYHEAWLSTHPDRDADWLAAKLKEGFDIHHLDGDATNNDPSNLVLIECLDHMRLHGKSWCRIKPRVKKPRKPRKPGELSKRQKRYYAERTDRLFLALDLVDRGFV